MCYFGLFHSYLHFKMNVSPNEHNQSTNCCYSYK